MTILHKKFQNLISPKQRHTNAVSTDWIGLIYQVEKLLGRTDCITFTSFFADTGASTRHFSHSQNDGLGALMLLLSSLGIENFEVPFQKLQTGKAENLSQGICQFLKDLKPSQISIRGKDSSYLTSCMSGLVRKNEATRVLDKESSADFFRMVRNERLKVSSVLLHFCHQILREQFLEDDQPHYKWLIPINMRTQNETRCVHNLSSGLGVDLSGCETLTRTHKQYVRSMNPVAAKLTYAASKIGRIVGKKGLYKLAKMRAAKNSWIGSFSSLGEFNCSLDQLNNSAKIPDAIAFFPPAGSPCFPFGFGTVTWNGCLSISLRIHASLSSDIVGSNAILNELIARISVFCAKELRCQNFLE